jgi:hypothetical protein
MIVTFAGHSDDIVAWGYGESFTKFREDEHYVKDVGPIGYATFRVATIGGTRSVLVHAIYGANGTWTFAYGQETEGTALPTSWTFTIDRAHDYSTLLVIDTRDDLVEVTPTFPESA